MVAAIIAEIAMTTSYLAGKNIETIYFGGGTPSVLSAEEINRILAQIAKHYHIAADAEITLETNPDDLLPAKVQALKQTAINRFSIGIQSFFEKDLVYMNRAHNAEQAHTCIKLVQDAGFKNLTIDFIYGTPTMNHDAWRSNLKTAFAYQIPHISAYCLTVEPKTALHHFVATGKAADVAEEHAAQQFEILVAQMLANGYEHYEISNFCQANQFSRHNSSYWQGKSYLGIGPSAHSFNGVSRQWNVAHNQQYLQAITQGNHPSEIENLTIANRFNEYLMTSLRTNWGCKINKVRNDFGDLYVKHLLANISPFVQAQLMTHHAAAEVLNLTSKGKFVADGIISELFFVEEE